MPAGKRQRHDQTEYDLRQSYRHLEQISAAAQRFSLELDRKKLLDLIAEQAYEILRADQVIVYSNYDNQLTPESWSPNVSEYPQDSDALPMWCVKYLKPKVDNRPESGLIRNAVCAPLLATQNRVLAVVEARNKRTGGIFTEQDLRVAVCLARVASSAVERANLFYRIEEWKQSIETLLSFNATVNQHLDPSEMVRELVKNVTGFLDADGGAAGIVIRQGDELTIVSDTFFYDGANHPYARQWKLNEGIPGTVAHTEFPLLVNDYGNNELADKELAGRFDIGSCICVPIKNAKEEVLGFFKLHRRTSERQFTWHDAAFLETLGNTAAVAIENARLVHSLELKNEQIKSLSQDHVRRLEEERMRIARELHDETGQVLVGLKLRLQVLAGMLSEEQAAAKEELVGLGTQLNQAASQLKDLAKKLRPPTLDELGFEASVRQLVSEYRKQVDFSIQVVFDARPELDTKSETALFRVVQECLTNVAKHSQASHVTIQYSAEDEQQLLRVKDDGVGFDLESSTNGLGLIGLKERVKMLNGTVTIGSKSNQGTSVTIRLPKDVRT